MMAVIGVDFMLYQMTTLENHGMASAHQKHRL